ncbi:MAG TPA: rod-binding protein [Xanthobacteraceae bacterium]|jgi:Rod binding domain-containing protein|nr:rod-binding protein [Xanthobacteraceae bacterium]
MTSLMPTLAAPGLDQLTPVALASRAKNASPSSPQARMRAQAQSFEAQFLNSMFQQMYAGVGGDGPFGNSQGVGPWRSLLTDEYAKSFAKNGGIGIADAVYKQMLARAQGQQAPQPLRPALMPKAHTI